MRFHLLLFTLHFKALFKMNTKDYLQDIKDIKQIMSQSTQFLSLSGLSGVLAGLYAISGSVYVYYLLEKNAYKYITLESKTFLYIVITAILVLFSSVLTAYFLTIKKAKKRNEKLWNITAKNLLINFSIPLVTGGIFCILLLKNKYYGLIVPITLIFYGLACVNASKYTLRDIRYLGITMIVLGLLSVAFLGFGLFFWAFGFGVCHILYGLMMYYKYDRSS